MPQLATKIPKEITEYKEKIIFNLTLRQLIGFIVSGGLSIGTFLLCTSVLGMSIDAAGYFAIAVSMPPMAIGFLQFHKMPFEIHFMLYLRQRFAKSHLVYETQTDEILNEFHSGKEDKKIAVTKKERRAERKLREYQGETE